MDTESTRRRSAVAVEPPDLRSLAWWISRRIGSIADRRRAVDARRVNATGPVRTVDGLVRFAGSGAILGRPITSAIDVNRPGAQIEVDLGRRYHDAAGGER